MGSQLTQYKGGPARRPLFGERTWMWVTTVAIATGFTMMSAPTLASTAPRPKHRASAHKAHSSAVHRAANGRRNSGAVPLHGPNSAGGPGISKASDCRDDDDYYYCRGPRGPKGDTGDRGPAGADPPPRATG